MKDIKKNIKKIKMTREIFQPKQINLWNLTIDGAIDSQYVKSCQLPIISKSTNFWGKRKDKFSPLIIEMYEPIGISYYKIFKQSLDLNSVWEITLRQVDPEGNIIEYYHFTGTTVLSISSSKFDYKTSELVTTKIFFQPKSVEFVD
jgi:hypothetical protein